MGHIEFILANRKKAQAASPSASPSNNTYDLPGFHRTDKNASDTEIQKKEYNFTLRQIQDLKTKKNSQRGEVRKETAAKIKGLQAHLNNLLGRIGAYNDDEAKHGFKEEDHGF